MWVLVGWALLTATSAPCGIHCQHLPWLRFLPCILTLYLPESEPENYLQSLDPPTLPPNSSWSWTEVAGGIPTTWPGKGKAEGACGAGREQKGKQLHRGAVEGGGRWRPLEVF